MVVTAEVQVVTGSVWVRFATLVILGVLMGLAASAWLHRSARRTLVIGVSAATLAWGTSVFRSYAYYDEIARVTYASPVPSTWLQPVNDHFQPLMFPLWWVQYGSVFKGSYVPISVSMYLFAVVGIVAAFFIARRLSWSLGRVGALTVALVVAVPLHNPDLWWWKGAGDAPVISLALLLAWLAILIRYGERLGAAAQVCAALLAFGAVFTSSSVTLIFVYVLPLLLIRRYRNCRLLIAIGSAAAISAVYWVLRTFVVDIGVSQYQHSLVDLPGAFLGMGIEYGYKNPLLVLLFGCLALIGLWTARSGSSEIRALVCLALLIIAIGGLQLWAARGMTFVSSRGLFGYHLYLPFLGITMLVGLGAERVLRWARLGSRALPLLQVAYLVVAVLLFAFPWRSAFTQDIPVDATLQARAEFFRDLQALGSVELPDLNLALSPAHKVMHFAPEEFLADPAEMNGWIRRMDLSLLLPMTGAEYVTSPCRRGKSYSPEVTAFIAKYWGPGDPCSYAISPAP